MEKHIRLMGIFQLSQDYKRVERRSNGAREAVKLFGHDFGPTEILVIWGSSHPFFEINNPDPCLRTRERSIEELQCLLTLFTWGNWLSKGTVLGYYVSVDVGIFQLRPSQRLLLSRGSFLLKFAKWKPHVWSNSTSFVEKAKTGDRKWVISVISPSKTGHN